MICFTQTILVIVFYNHDENSNFWRVWTLLLSALIFVFASILFRIKTWVIFCKYKFILISDIFVSWYVTVYVYQKKIAINITPLLSST